MARKKKTRVFVVDDHSIVRQGIIQLINQEDDMAVCGEAEDGQMCLEKYPAAKPQVIMLDLSYKEGMGGLEIIKQIRSRDEKVSLLVLSMHDESIYAERVLRAGAQGYIMKQEATEKVMVAIRRVMEGQIYVSEKISSKLLTQLTAGSAKGNKSPLERLSDRELEVFELIGQGQSTRNIADKLFLSVKTVETYRANLKSKLDLKNASELVQRAVQWVQNERGI